MPTYALSDVDPYAITICKQGANRKRIFLKKSAPDPSCELPAEGRILKDAGEDWSAFYCVVAEPGAREDPGLVGVPGSEDVWASEDEIRKAAHRFARNKGYVNTFHDAMAAEGCHVVENAIALTDIEVGGEVIRKGSWYLAIEPNAEAKAKVDRGEIQGVSIEGTGLRTLVAKSHAGENVAGPVKSLVAHYMKKPHPFTSCYRDNVDRFGPERAKRICATLKDMGTGTHDWRGKGKEGVRKATEEEFVTRWADDLISAGVTADDVEPLRTYFASESSRYAESVPADADTRSAFRKVADALGLGGDLRSEGLDAEPVSVPKEETAVTDPANTPAAPEARLDSIESSVADLRKDSTETATAVKALAEGFEKLLSRVAPEKEGEDGAEDKDAKPAAELKKAIDSLADRLDSIDGDLTNLAKSVSTLAEGESAQPAQPDTIRKTDPENPLAGLLS